MKYEVNGIVVMTDDVTDAGLRKEHESEGGTVFQNFLEFLIEGILDAYDELVSDKRIKSIELFEYEDLYFGITFNFADGWSYTINRDQSWGLY